jgi:hypothetical protein
MTEINAMIREIQLDAELFQCIPSAKGATYDSRRLEVQSLRNDGLLGAGFFFKKGEDECGNATFLSPTIAAQLVQFIANFKEQLRKPIQESRKNSRAIISLPPAEQFGKLLLRPLTDLTPAPQIQTRVVVIDALGESNADVETIVELVARAKDIENVSLRFLIRSREEPPIEKA